MATSRAAINIDPHRLNSTFYPLAGAAALALAVIGTTALVARYSAFYRRELAPDAHRQLPLDGLRGLAALMVAVTHAALCGVWLGTGEWGRAESPLLELLAPAGVILFFMLTGYLFWDKARAAGGKLNAWKLWRGRLYRIGPLYLFSLVALLCVAAAQTGGHWIAWENWKSLARLFALGALRWHTIGSINPDDYNAGVVWTLWYEWAFYLSLPFIAWLATGRKIFAVGAAVYGAVLIGLWFQFNLQPGLFFILGMLCPVLLEGRRSLTGPSVAIFALVAALVVSLLEGRHLFANRPPVSLAAVLFPVFIIAAAGNSFFGILTRPAFRCLGAISFSLYLLHGITFRLAAGLLKANGLTDLPPFEYWLVFISVAVGTTLLCAATYRWIEHPFLSASHRRPETAAAGAEKTPFVPARNI